jgi:hypothetical protein
VRREAIVAAIDLGDGQRDPLAGLGRQGALGQRARQREIALERLRAGGDEAEQVRCRAELLDDGFQ